MMQPETRVLSTSYAKYIPVSGMTANESFLSKSRYETFKKLETDKTIRTVGDRGAPQANQRFDYVSERTRTDKGRGFLDSSEDYVSRRKRLGRSRQFGAAKWALGGLLVKGVPVLLAAWTVHDIVRGDYATGYSDDVHDAFGPMGLPITIGVETGKAALSLAALANPMSGGSGFVDLIFG